MGNDGGDGVRELIRGEVEAIRSRIDDYLDDRDDRSRSDALSGLAAEGPDVRRVLRYEREALGRLRAWTRALRRLQDPRSGRGGRDNRAPEGPEGPPMGPFEPDRPDNTTDAGEGPEIAPDLPSRIGPMSAAIRDALGRRARSTIAPSITPLATSPSPRPNRRCRRAQAAQARRSGRP